MNNFGSCCKDLYEAMNSPSNSFFRIENNGVFFLTVGYMQSEQGTGWFDQAVIFCPFCGVNLQNRQQIKLKSQMDDESGTVN